MLHFNQIACNYYLAFSTSIIRDPRIPAFYSNEARFGTFVEQSIGPSVIPVDDGVRPDSPNERFKLKKILVLSDVRKNGFGLL